MQGWWWYYSNEGLVVGACAIVSLLNVFGDEVAGITQDRGDLETTLLMKMEVERKVARDA